MGGSPAPPSSQPSVLQCPPGTPRPSHPHVPHTPLPTAAIHAGFSGPAVPRGPGRNSAGAEQRAELRRQSSL